MTCPLYFSGKILRDFFPVFFFSPFDKEISFLSKTLDVSKTLREQQSQACCVWIHSFKIYSTADVIVITMQCVHLKFCWLCKWTPPNKSFRYFYNLCFFIQTSQKQQSGCGFIWENRITSTTDVERRSIWSIIATLILVSVTYIWKTSLYSPWYKYLFSNEYKADLPQSCYNPKTGRKMNRLPSHGQVLEVDKQAQKIESYYSMAILL